jgi:assimilatory nitrate reductase catalytic subunit
VDPASLPRKGKSAVELLDAFGPGGIRGLLVVGSNVSVAAPDSARVAGRLRSLDLLVVCDAFPNETAGHAHAVLPIAQWAEEDGTLTNLEGRVIRRRAMLPPPPGVWTDGAVLRGLADRLGWGPQFAFATAREVFDEFRRATAGGPADYSGITWERIDREGGVFWPCPGEGHPGTPYPFAERFAHPDGKARFHAVEHRPAGEEPDADYPLYFTTGRDAEHYNSGAQTRRLPTLSGRRPLPRLHLHPHTARRLGVAAGETVTVESRRGSAEFVAHVTADIRPDTLFAPFHWGGRQSANLLTHGTLDPISRMPEFKVAAARVRKAAPPRDGVG